MSAYVEIEFDNHDGRFPTSTPFSFPLSLSRAIEEIGLIRD